MAIKKRGSTIDVLEAARCRIRNLFNTGVRVYLDFSSGKDSLVVSSLIYDLIKSGDIDARQLTVVFVDEEGLYPDMVDAAERWRGFFTSVGVEFWWFCLPFKQVCTIDSLTASESWITWEASERDVWMREPPPYAIFNHPLLEYEGQYNYATFLDKLCKDGVSVCGLRLAESLQRNLTFSKKKNKTAVALGKTFWPIYDWKDGDVWKYIADRGLEFPEVYIRLYEAGVRRNNLRLCCFFGDSSVVGLKWVAETDPELWERIERRMPSAELALLYWDSEMFAHSTKQRRELESDGEARDYKRLAMDVLFYNTANYTIGADTLKNINSWRNFVKKRAECFCERDWKTVYEGLLFGDPKNRTLRALEVRVGANRGK